MTLFIKGAALDNHKHALMYVAEGRMEKQKKTNLGQQELNRISKRSFKVLANTRIVNK